MLKIISWNMGHRAELWRTLTDSGADIALLQEACEPPSDVASQIKVDDLPWRTPGVGKARFWRTAVAGFKPSVAINRLTPCPISEISPDAFAVSRPGTLAVGRIEDPDTGEKYTLISMYALWERPHSSTRSEWIYADASAHRLISDISALVGQERGHRILAAGDLNVLYGYGDYGSRYWAARYKTIFDRFAAIGLAFVGPQFPNGRQAAPWPDELPRNSLNVPTFHSNRQTPATATRQLDFVFASKDIAYRVSAQAFNLP